MTGPAHPDDVLDFSGLTDLSALDHILDEQTLKGCRGRPILKIATKRQYEIFDGTAVILSGRFSSIHEMPIDEQSGLAVHEESRLLEFARTK